MRVIALDDEIDVQVLYEHFLEEEIESEKIDFVFYNDPKKLLESLKPSEERTLLMTDLRMPGLSGFEVVSALIQRMPNLMVFIISALEVDLEHPNLNGVRYKKQFLKPLNFNLLREEILSLL